MFLLSRCQWGSPGLSYTQFSVSLQHNRQLWTSTMISTSDITNTILKKMWYIWFDSYSNSKFKYVNLTVDFSRLIFNIAQPVCTYSMSISQRHLFTRMLIFRTWFKVDGSSWFAEWTLWEHNAMTRMRSMVNVHRGEVRWNVNIIIHWSIKTQLF